MRVLEAAAPGSSPWSGLGKGAETTPEPAVGCPDGSWTYCRAWTSSRSSPGSRHRTFPAMRTPPLCPPGEVGATHLGPVVRTTPRTRSRGAAGREDPAAPPSVGRPGGHRCRPPRRAHPRRQRHRRRRALLKNHPAGGSSERQGCGSGSSCRRCSVSMRARADDSAVSTARMRASSRTTPSGAGEALPSASSSASSSASRPRVRRSGRWSGRSSVPRTGGSVRPVDGPAGGPPVLALVLPPFVVPGRPTRHRGQSFRRIVSRSPRCPPCPVCRSGTKRAERGEVTPPRRASACAASARRTRWPGR